jgi:hypothetical protein
MNVEIGTEAALFPEKEYINGIFLAVYHYQLFFLSMSVASTGFVFLHDIHVH